MTDLMLQDREAKRAAEQMASAKTQLHDYCKAQLYTQCTTKQFHPLLCSNSWNLCASSLHSFEFCVFVVWVATVIVCMSWYTVHVPVYFCFTWQMKDRAAGVRKAETEPKAGECVCLFQHMCLFRGIYPTFVLQHRGAPCIHILRLDLF